jgi:hypothetical protein
VRAGRCWFISLSNSFILGAFGYGLKNDKEKWK